MVSDNNYYYMYVNVDYSVQICIDRGQVNEYLILENVFECDHHIIFGIYQHFSKLVQKL